jgi:hypothetical protein
MIKPGGCSAEKEASEGVAGRRGLRCLLRSDLMRK